MVQEQAAGRIINRRADPLKGTASTCPFGAAGTGAAAAVNSRADYALTLRGSRTTVRLPGT
jgi:hypothetical protein